MEPIFSSDDINRQLPVEGKRYLTMERTWRKIMKAAHDNNKVSMVRLLNHTIFDSSVHGSPKNWDVIVFMSPGDWGVSRTTSIGQSQRL